MVESHITATEMARTLSDVLNRVKYRGEAFVIERGGEPVGRLSPAGPTTLRLSQLSALLTSAPSPDAGFAGDVAEAASSQPLAPKGPWEQ